MPRFLGEQIEVETERGSPRPVRFAWKDEMHIVTKVLSEWVDTGYGLLPRTSRTWYNRRHRRYFRVSDSDGRLFEIYLDYADRRHPTWWLVRELEPGQDLEETRRRPPSHR